MPNDNPRGLWQEQPAEPSTLTPELLLLKTQSLHAKNRRDLFRGLAIPGLIVALLACAIAWGAGPVTESLLACAFAWGLAGQYSVIRGSWSATPQTDPARSTGLALYRQELERRRSVFDRFLLCSFGPIALALASLIALLINLGAARGMLVPATLLRMAPFLILLALWLVSVTILRMKDRRELGREIAVLNELEKADNGTTASYNP